MPRMLHLNNFDEVNRNRSLSVHADTCRLSILIIQQILIKGDHKISCDYQFLSKFVLEFDFYLQRICQVRDCGKRTRHVLSFFGCNFRFTWYILMQTATISNLCIGQIEASTWPPPLPPGIPQAHLTPLPSRGGGNLIIRVFQGVGNLIPMR